MNFNTKEESDEAINFLDMNISKDDNKIMFNIYSKPTATDITIPNDSCHPSENKLVTITYLTNRLSTYPTNEREK